MVILGKAERGRARRKQKEEMGREVRKQLHYELEVCSK